MKNHESQINAQLAQQHTPYWLRRQGLCK